MLNFLRQAQNLLQRVLDETKKKHQTLRPSIPRAIQSGESGGLVRTSEFVLKPAAWSSSITRLAALTNFRFVTSLNI